MPELFVLGSLSKNAKNYSVRQQPNLLTYNQPSQNPVRHSYKERTEIYVVPNTDNDRAIYNKQPHKSPTPSARSDDPLTPDTPQVYNLPPPQKINKPPPQRKIYYRPLRYEPKRVQQPYKPITPPIRKSYPEPTPVTTVTRIPTQPVVRSSPSPTPPPPLINQSNPSPILSVNRYQPLPVDAPEFYHLNGTQLNSAPSPYVPQRVEQPYKSPPPPVVTSYPTPPPPVKQSYPSSLDAPELYHLNRTVTAKQPVIDQPMYAEQPYKPSTPPAPLKTSAPPISSPVKQSYVSPPPPPPVQQSYPLSLGGPELYHLNHAVTANQPINDSTPPISSPVNTYIPPASQGPQLYHLNDDTIEDIPMPDTPKPVEQVYKSPLPPQSPLPVTVAPNPPSYNGPELYHFNAREPVNEPIQQSPVSSAKKPTSSPTPSNDRAELYYIKLEDTTDEPKPVEQSYKSPTPPPQPIKTISPSPLPVTVTPNPPSRNGPELYHLNNGEIINEPVQQSPKSPVQSAKMSSPPPQNGPELYYIKFDEPINEEQPRKPSTPRIPSGKNRVSPMPSPKPTNQEPEMYYLQTFVDNSRRSPSIQEPAPKPASPIPIVTKVREITPPPRSPTPPPRLPTPPPPRWRSPSPPLPQRSPSPLRHLTPSPLPPPRSPSPLLLRRRSPSPPLRRRLPSPPPPPRRRSPSPPRRTLHTAAPLALPVRRPLPVLDDVDDVDDVPVRRDSFPTTLQGVLIADRVVPLSVSKAPDSIKRSMNKFRYDDN
ncbi:unnamed protein product [Adineta steineri]|uniref:Uncharacterized protein n=1 Tax=Adineta steineri TaxID=433720 RepID=A0A815N724_9BILA|nr:unnamed protein product [Adineta steineri]